jgi:predicted RNA-binding protein with TRAM domain
MAFLLTFLITKSEAQNYNTDFSQGSNKNPTLGNVVWIGSILQSNNSQFFEGQSTLQRVFLMDIPAHASGKYKLQISHQAMKSTSHAYDFILNWDKAIATSNAIFANTYASLNSCAQLGPKVTAAQCAAFDGANVTTVTAAPVAAAVYSTNPSGGAVAPDNVGAKVQAFDNANGGDLAARGIVIKSIGANGSAVAVSNAQAVFVGYSGSDLYADYELRWDGPTTGQNYHVLVMLAGHLAVGGTTASGIAYGPNKGASNINGGPYHFKLGNIVLGNNNAIGLSSSSANNVSLGAQDNQIQGSEIIACNVQAQASGGTITCASPTIQISGAGSSTGANFSYSWSGPQGATITNGTTLTPTVNAAGVYTLTVTNSQGGCSATASASVSVNQTPPTAQASGGTITCATTSVALGIGNSSTGANITYAWSGPNSFSSASATPSVTAGGQYTLTVTNTTNGCTATASASVSVNQTPPTAQASGGTITCATTSVALGIGNSSTGANITYAWSGPNSFSSASATPSVTAGGQYTLTVTNTTNGCTATASASVSVNQTPPTAQASGGTITCATTSVALGIGNSSTGANITYAWSGPNSFSSASATPSVTAGGQYTLTVTNTTNGCTATASASVSVNQTPPTAQASGGTIPCGQASIQISGTGSSTGQHFTYMWSGPGTITNGTTLSPTVNAGGTYTLTVTNTTNGCTATATASVTKITQCGAPYGSYTQGYYGNTNGNSCNNGQTFTGPLQHIRRLLGLTAPAGQTAVPNPLIVGVKDVLNPTYKWVEFTANEQVAALINSSMPGGGTARALVTTGFAITTNPDATWTTNYLTKQGRINNVLLSQTIVLTLNTRLGNSGPSGNLMAFPIKYNGGAAAFFYVQNLQPVNGTTCGSTIPVACTYRKVTLNASVVNYLTNNGLKTDATVADLLMLANKLLAGALVPGSGVPSYADVSSVVDAFNNAFDGWKYWTGDYNVNLTNPSVTVSSVMATTCAPNPGNMYTVNYSAASGTGAPFQYQIDWPSNSGLADVPWTTLSGAITRSANVAAGIYTGQMQVRNTLTGCMITIPLTLTVTPCLTLAPTQQGGGLGEDRTLRQAEVTRLNVSTYPNPFKDVVKFVIASPVSGRAQLEVFNTLGQKLNTVYTGYIQANQTQIVEYKTSAVAKQNLFYIFRINGKQVTGKLLNAEQ